ncbi:hypothetical protein QA634_32365 [Methylobacterium sp. CB376]|uniref:hypothetical protein n=1 Tax=unclassified Methylobacterium TaxID=2615210 RepID=UPI000152BFDF|nr:MULTISPECIES: hypothetical protein [Methylobacterium]WFT79827.1 hypothetical protein QA634_32365 [Methylobacterium nodulans]
MENIEFDFDFGFEFGGGDLHRLEKEELERFLYWYQSLNSAFAQPLAELIGVRETDDMVRRFLEIEGIRACLERDPEFVNVRLDEMPRFPYKWPDNLDPIYIAHRTTQLKRRLLPSSFDAAERAEIARRMRKQAASLLQGADKVEQGTF